MTTFLAGDRVIIRPEWRDGSDDAAEFVIVEWNGDRGYVQPLTWEYGPLVPRELVRDYMIEEAK